jgi:hypothetical protein
MRAVGRASGDGWTTVANSWLSECYYSYVCYRADIPEDRWDGLFAGDDVLMNMTEHYRVRFQEEFDLCFAIRNEDIEFGIGQVCKDPKWGDIEDVSFKSCWMYRTKYGIAISRNLARFFKSEPFSAKVDQSLFDRVDRLREQIAASLIVPKNLFTKLLKAEGELHQAKMALFYAKLMCAKAWTHDDEGGVLPIVGTYVDHMLSLLPQELTDKIKTHRLATHKEYADHGRITSCKVDREAFLGFLSHRCNTTIEALFAIDTQIQEIDGIHEVREISELKAFYTYN